ncbi:MAG: signal peptide peptidase SppA [Bacteroidia bacterium]|nr:signal peptide peptidase SppA [Bacteroidia bacterium]
MKNFFGAFLGSCLGVLLSMGLLVMLMVFAIKGLESSLKGEEEDDQGTEITKDGILKLELNGELTDRQAEEDPLSDLNLPFSDDIRKIGLNKLRKCFENAAKNDRVKGVLLIFEDLRGGMASLQEFRQILEQFKKSTQGKKPLWAYSETYGHGTYYVASACNKVFLHPQGDFRWQGLSAQIMFYKEMLAKLGIEIQVFRHGKFKSAVEPFILDKMSPENRKQFESFLNSIWTNMLEEISSSRQIGISELQKAANELEIKNADDALRFRMVDALAYWDEVEKEIRDFLKIKDEKEKINFISRADVEGWANPDRKITSEKIAVVYAVGGIESGEGDNETIGSEGLAKAIRKAADKENVKAIVLRVNSPGGSALASDVIWKEVMRAKKKKPLIVSMGDYAASGGYYISCAADKIFAQKNTITGSIGVFGMIPNVSGLLKEKAGIYTDTVNTNRYSDLGGIYRKYTDKEKEYIQASVERIYDVFITRVSDGRKMEKPMVDSIGQGRVWSGKEGASIGLVDAFGGLEDAVIEAAKRAKLNQYNIIEYPEWKSPLSKFLNQKGSEDEAGKIIKSLKNKEISRAYHLLQMLRNEKTSVWAWWPFSFEIR